MDDPKARESELLQREAKRSKAFLRWMVLLLFIVNAAIIFKVLVPTQPTYKGKTVAKWLRHSVLEMDRYRQADRFADLRVDPEAVNAFGPDVWPDLMKAIKQKDSNFSKAYSALWQRLPLRIQHRLLSWHPIKSEMIGFAAYQWLAQLGPDGKGAVPDLVMMALHEQKPDTRVSAIGALGNVGFESPEALSALIEILQKEPAIVVSPGYSLQKAAYFAVARFGAKAKPAVPILIEWVRARKDGTPTNEITVLGFIGPEAKEAVPVLAEALKNPLLRQSALNALAAIGAGAQEAVAALIEILKESADNPRAIEILFRVGPPAKDALPVLREIESRATNILRGLAAMAISRIETSDPQRAVPSLIAAFKEKWPQTGPRWRFEIKSFGLGSHVTFESGPSFEAAWLLGELGAVSETALLELKEVPTSGNPFLRILAAPALCGLQGIEPALLTDLDKGLNQSGVTDVGFHFTLLTFERMGPRAREAAPLLLQFINTKTNWWVRRRAVLNVLEKIDPAAAAKVSLR